MSDSGDITYGTEVDYSRRVSTGVTKRKETVRKLLHKVFQAYLKTRDEDLIDFSEMDTTRLAQILHEFPGVLKPLLAFGGIGSRAIQRDLKMAHLDTYSPRITLEESGKIAGLLNSFLSGLVLVETLVEMDRAEFADKEKRRMKGAWEGLVRDTFATESGEAFVKRRFGKRKEFEIDVAYPDTGPIQIAVDVKRIEARRDHQKRSDEIINKAASLKKLYPSAKFAAFVYYPFDHEEVEARLSGTQIDLVVFAGENEDSVRKATRQVITRFRFRRSQTSFV